jgi:outer membrane protein assembly factor BamB
MKRVPSHLIVLALAVLCFAAPLRAGDWPQFRFGPARSAASADQLPAELSLRWVRELPAPRPAFNGEVRLRYDASYEPVVMGKTMFVPSMVTDSVTALDTNTGQVRWRFFAEGPVRFAPIAWQEKVYFISDDGHLYCLNAKDGTLRWKFRGLPAGREDRKLLGNGRLVSLRPARGGPVLADGVIYFAAGMWPQHGVFVHAIDAKTGKARWSNTDSHHLAGANLDHGIKSFAGITPQGYLAIVGNMLVVPCGAQLPAFLDLKTGKLRPYTMGWGGRVGLPKGSWFVAGSGNYLTHSGDLYDMSRPNDERFKNRRGKSDFKSQLYAGGWTRISIDPTNQRALGDFRVPVMAGEQMFVSGGGSVLAYDLKQGKVTPRTKAGEEKIRKNDRYPDKLKATFPELWKLPTKLSVHIKSGQRLYVGGPGEVAAIDIPDSTSAKPKISWQSKIEGTPSRMLVADDKLIVITLEGKIYTYGAKAPGKPLVHKTPQVAAVAKPDEWTKRAAEILKQTGVSEGYALVLGIDTGRLVEELVSQSKCSVIVVDSDAKKIDALRRRMLAAGLYGTRVSALVGDPANYPFPPFLANLVVSEDVKLLGDSFDETFLRNVFHPLRPYGGVACLSASAEQRQQLADTAAKLKLAGLHSESQGELALISRQGPLPGASDWSHNGATASNTGGSQDTFLRGDLDMLWFGGAVRWYRKPGNAVVRVAGGRLLIKAGDLYAIDAYTGRQLWRAKLPTAVRTTTGTEIVVLDDAIYLTGGRSCLVLNAVTGEKTREISLPDATADSAGRWTNLRVWDDYLLGSSNKTVTCFDRRSGKLLWTFTANRAHLSIAAAGDRVFCSELINRRKGEKPADGRILALSAKQGNILWQIPASSVLRYADTQDLLIATGGVYRGKDGSKVRDNAAPFFIAGDKLVGGGGDQLITFDLDSGKKVGKDMKWNRRGCTDMRACPSMVTTRYRGNAAYIDLATRRITPLWNVRSACSNNLIPGDGLLNVPNLTGGCECNYTPTSIALVPSHTLRSIGGVTKEKD